MWSATRTPMFEAQTSILVNQGDSTDLFGPDSGSGSGARSTENEARFLRSSVVAAEAIEQLGYQAEIRVAADNSADVLRAIAISEDPVRARETAQTFSEAYIRLRRASAVKDYTDLVDALLDRVAALDAQISSATADAERQTFELRKTNLEGRINDLSITSELLTGRAEIIDPAELPEAPFSPQTARNVALGSILGLLAGIAAALLIETLDVSIRSSVDLERATNGLPNLATIGVMSKRSLSEHRGLVTLSRGSEFSPEAEPYRTLRAGLQFVAVDRDMSVLQITSSVPGEGKSTTASNLAAVLAKNNHRVILVDCDLRKPRLHAIFDVPQEPGLTSVLIGECALSAAQRTITSGDGSLSLITSGPIPPGPSELLGSDAAAKVFSLLGEAADYVIIDSPPTLPVADALVLSRHVDATVLVANASRSTQHDVERALEMLERAEAPVLGTVLNQFNRRRGSGGYGYGYGYGYGHQAAASSPIMGRLWGRYRGGGNAEPGFESSDLRADDVPTQLGEPNGNTSGERGTIDLRDPEAGAVVLQSVGAVVGTASSVNGSKVNGEASSRIAESELPQTSASHTQSLPDANASANGTYVPDAFAQLVGGDGWLDDDISAL